MNYSLRMYLDQDNYLLRALNSKEKMRTCLKQKSVQKQFNFLLVKLTIDNYFFLIQQSKERFFVDWLKSFIRVSGLNSYCIRFSK